MRCGLIPALVAPLSAAAGASDFTGDLFHADDELSALGDGRSQLDVVETIVARFRDFDQNRGDRRGDAREHDAVDLQTAVSVAAVG